MKILLGIIGFFIFVNLIPITWLVYFFCIGFPIGCIIVIGYGIYSGLKDPPTYEETHPDESVDELIEQAMFNPIFHDLPCNVFHHSDDSSSKSN